MGPQRAGGGHRHGPAQVQCLPPRLPRAEGQPENGRVTRGAKANRAAAVPAGQRLRARQAARCLRSAHTGPGGHSPPRLFFMHACCFGALPLVRGHFFCYNKVSLGPLGTRAVFTGRKRGRFIWAALSRGTVWLFILRARAAYGHPLS